MKNPAYRVEIRSLTIPALCLVFWASLFAGLLAQNTPAPMMVDPAIDAQGPFCYLAKSSTSLSVPGSPWGAQVTFDGAISNAAGELCFFYGQPLRPVMARNKELLDGWIPVVHYSFRDASVFYSAESFAASLDENPASDLVVFVRLEAVNLGDTPATATLAAGLRYSGGDHRFERLRARPFSPDWTYEMSDNILFRDNAAVLYYPAGLRKEAVPDVAYMGPFKGRDQYIMDLTPAGVTRLQRLLAPGERFTLDYKIPPEPVSRSMESRLDHINSATHDEYREKIVKFWSALLSRGAELSLSEKKVMDAHRSSLMYPWQAIWPKDDYWVQGVNRFQYRGFWLRDGAYIALANELWGHHDIARRTLEHYHLYQKEDGLFYSYKGQLDGFGQALHTLGMHAILTNDREWAESVYHHFPPAVEWLRKARAEDPMHIMPATTVRDNEFITGHYTGHNFWALLGLRTAIRLARMTGHDEDAAAFTREYEDYRRTFLDKLTEVFGTDGPMFPGLDTEEGQDWGNLIGLWPAEVLDPADPRVAATLRKMRSEKYQEGLMTYMGRMHHYLTVKAAQNFVVRGEQEEALRDFYSILLHMGSTNEMFEWQAVPWGDRDVSGNFPPHGWGAAMFNLLLRNMIVREAGGDGGLKPRELHLFSVLSPEWTRPGDVVKLDRAPTDHGLLSLRFFFEESRARLQIQPEFHSAPAEFVLHVPWYFDLQSYETDATSSTLSAGVIRLSPDAAHVDLVIKRRLARSYSFEKTVAEYRSEYARRFAEYVAAGGAPSVLTAPPLRSAEERRAEFLAMYTPQPPGIAVGKPVTSSGEVEDDHKPDLAVDGNAWDRDGSSWWVGPPGPVWLMVDLEKTISIGAVHVYPYWDGGRYYQYIVEASADSASWTKIADMRNNTTPSTAKGNYHPFTPLNARYVRITFYFNSANTSFHLVELKVFPAGE